MHDDRSREVRSPFDDDDVPMVVNELDRLMPPYIVPNADDTTCHAQVLPLPTGYCTTQVSMSTAITLVNRYCAQLPADMYTCLAPQCDVEEFVGVR